MTQPSSRRKSDQAHLRGTGSEHDMSDFVGDWRCTDASTPSLPRVLISERSGQAFVRVWGTGLEPNAPAIDWGERPASLFETAPGDPQSGGLLTSYDLGFAEVTVAGNSKRGVLVLATYTVFKDGSNRRSYYTREFFHLARQADNLAGQDGPVVVAAAEPQLLGSWLNTSTQSTGIEAFMVQPVSGVSPSADAKLTLRGALGGPFAGMQTDVLARVCGTVAFVADCRFGEVDLQLSANLNRGLLIIAAFYTDANQHRHFRREFYYRDDHRVGLADD